MQRLRSAACHVIQLQLGTVRLIPLRSFGASNTSITIHGTTALATILSHRRRCFVREGRHLCPAGAATSPPSSAAAALSWQPNAIKGEAVIRKQHSRGFCSDTTDDCSNNNCKPADATAQSNDTAERDGRTAAATQSIDAEQDSLNTADATVRSDDAAAERDSPSVELYAQQTAANKETRPQRAVPGRGAPPELPVLCCMSGCEKCVWLVYADELLRYYSDVADDDRTGRQVLDAIDEHVDDANLKAYLLFELRLKGIKR